MSHENKRENAGGNICVVDMILQNKILHIPLLGDFSWEIGHPDNRLIELDCEFPAFHCSSHWKAQVDFYVVRLKLDYLEDLLALFQLRGTRRHRLRGSYRLLSSRTGCVGAGTFFPESDFRDFSHPFPMVHEIVDFHLEIRKRNLE